MALLNYTTKIDADKTAHEIGKCLSMHGAQAVLTEYNKEEGYVEALSFQISLKGQKISFRLPCDWKPVLAVLEEQHAQGKLSRSHQGMPDRTQAVRTAWRIVKDWVEAQMALVETNMVTTEQVFLPYAVMPNGKTLGENIQANPRFLLGNGKAE